MPRSARGVRQRIRKIFGLPTAQRVGEPGPGERPVPVGGPARDAQGLGRVTQRHPGEEPQLHQFGGYGELIRQSVEGVVEFEEVVVGGGGRAGELVEVDPIPSAARFSRPRSRAWLTSTRRIASAAAAKKCAFRRTAGPRSAACKPHAPARWHRGCAPVSPRPSARRELPQLVVNEREQVGRRLAVAGRGGFKEVGDLGHNDRVYRLHHNVKTDVIGHPRHLAVALPSVERYRRVSFIQPMFHLTLKPSPPR